MGDLLAEHLVVDVGMGIDMDQRHRPVLLFDRAQDRVGQRVVAAERERNAIVRENVVIGRSMMPTRLLEVERVDRHVADIRHLQGIEGHRPRRHVVGAEHAGFGADLARPMARAGAVRGADVDRHADEAGVEPFGAWPALGSRIMVAGPAKRGISLPPSG